MRSALALILALSVPLHAEPTNDPLWTLFTSYAVDRDEKAADSDNVGKEDAKRLASLQADLQLLAGGFESFRDESQVKENLVKLEPRITTELRPFFKDRSSSLETIYRTLAVTDYTWANRFPQPPCSPAQARRKLLENRDGLFQNAKGESSPWLVSLLGPQAEGKSAEQALDQASAKNKLGAAEYEKRRASIRKLTLALASDKAVGEARSRLYCLRASAYEDLAASQGPAATAPTLAARATPQTAPEPSVFVVVSGARRAAATMVETKFGPVLVTDAAITAGDDHPRLFTHSGAELAATVARRDEGLGLATLTFDGTATGLPLAAQTPAKDELVTALGHTEVSGLWTKTSGLVSKSGPDSFQTDAAVSADFSGGPVLNDAGEVAGLLVQHPADTEEGRWPVAVPAGKIVLWLEGAQVSPGPANETIEDAGTAAVLSRTRPSLLTKTAAGDRDIWITRGGSVNPPMGNIVCMAHCGSSSSSRSSGSSYSGSSSYSSYSSEGGRELGEALGKLAVVGISALFRGIGKLFSGKGKAPAKDSPALVDNRHYQKVTTVKETPQPKPDPLKPVSLALTVSRSVLAQGQDLEATATVGFTGTEGTRAGLAVSFTVVGGKLNCPSGRTDAGGIARVTCTSPFVEKDRAFDGLQDETRRRLGMKVPERIRRKPAKGDKIAEQKERMADAQAKLDIEEGKTPTTGTDTPGLDKTIPDAEPEEYVVKGDRVTLGATLSGLTGSVAVDVIDRPCPPNKPLFHQGGRDYECGRPDRIGSKDSFRSEEPESKPADEGSSKPGNESRPNDAPPGTKPIDRSGLSTDQIHDIKHSIEARPKDWTGISPDEDVISSDPSGRAINHGNWRDHTNHH